MRNKKKYQYFSTEQCALSGATDQLLKKKKKKKKKNKKRKEKLFGVGIMKIQGSLHMVFSSLHNISNTWSENVLLTCPQQRLRSEYPSTQSHQRLPCLLAESLDPCLSTENPRTDQTARIPIVSFRIRNGV